MLKMKTNKVRAFWKNQQSQLEFGKHGHLTLPSAQWPAEASCWEQALGAQEAGWHLPWHPTAWQPLFTLCSRPQLWSPASSWLKEMEGLEGLGHSACLTVSVTVMG